MGRERRGFERNRSFARVLVSHEGRMGYVADMGERGFRVVFLSGATLVPGGRVRLLLAFSELGIEPFELDVVVRWCAWDLGALGAGFELCSEPEADAGRSFEAIGRYYAGHPAAEG
jgi:hypothetical protein